VKATSGSAMRAAALLLLAVAACAAQETNGSITRTVTGDATHTVVTVSSVTPGALVFQVTLLIGPTIADNPYKLVYRPSIGPGQAAAVMAIFDVPLAKVNSVSVREFAAGESQLFVQQ
jgi:hypothetical protein